MTAGSRLFLDRVALEGFLELPTRIQRQVVRKLRDVEAAPESMGYPLRRPLQGFRGVHSGRYRVIWRMLTLEGGERDAYSEAERIFGNMGWLSE